MATANTLMQTSREEFVEYIRNATEKEAWQAIGDASLIATWFRTGTKERAAFNRTIDMALAAYESTFGHEWLPF